MNCHNCQEPIAFYRNQHGRITTRHGEPMELLAARIDVVIPTNAQIHTLPAKLGNLCMMNNENREQVVAEEEE